MIRKGLSDDGWQQEPCFMRFSAPGRKVPRFPVIAVVGQVLLWPDPQNGAVVDQHSGVVPYSAVQDRHTEITEQVVRRTTFHEVDQRFPAVVNRVELKEVVLTTISTELEFRSETVRCTLLLGFDAAFVDTFGVAVKVHCPLIQLARRHRYERHGGRKYRRFVPCFVDCLFCVCKCVDAWVLGCAFELALLSVQPGTGQSVESKRVMSLSSLLWLTAALERSVAVMPEKNVVLV